MSVLRHRGTRRVALVAAVALLGVLVPPTTAQAAGGDLTFIGHGYGHGRGMGQYGALGYAVDQGWDAAQILAHFYGGTTLGNVGNPEMTVELLGLTGKQLVVTGPGLTVNNAPVGANAVRLTVSGANVQVEKGTGCVSSWTPMAGTFGANATRVRTTAPDSSLDNLLRVCEATDERAYRGELSVVSSGGTQITINHLPTESYLRGVVPRESPASWGALGGGRGLQALKAQAVAARSYALASTRTSGAHTCDTTACQVYGGAGVKTSSWTVLENSVTDSAVSQTAGAVLLASGAPVRAEFSSSTGGYTAGGAFPAVEDAGDSISVNPNHVWTTAPFALSDLASRLGTGAIRSMVVTARNGLGADGGRVTAVVVTTTAGQQTTFTGNQVRLALGLKSDWFSISGTTPAEAQAAVQALYQDVLGRSADPGGLSTWSAVLLSGWSMAQVATALATSREYANLTVVQDYQTVLGRAPDPGGMRTWSDAIVNGAVRSEDLQVMLYSSAEFFAKAGGTNVTYVAALYQGILGRTAGSAEVALWTDAVSTRGTFAVTQGFWRSYESALRRVDAAYQRYLGRSADPAGLATWPSVLLTRGEGELRSQLVGSLEYWNRAQTRFP